MSEKIRTQHLERKAILYVRQSSPYQRCCRNAPSRLHKPDCFLLELQRVPASFSVPHLLSLSLLQQLAKGSYERGCQEKNPPPAPLVMGSCLACIQPDVDCSGAVSLPCIS